MALHARPASIGIGPVRRPVRVARLASRCKANQFSISSGDEVTPLGETRVAIFSCSQYVRDFMEKPIKKRFPDSSFIEAALNAETAPLARGHSVINIFVNDTCTREVAEKLAEAGVKLITLRCAGFDRVDVQACHDVGIKVARVPTYSPQSVAEHALALMMALNRHLHKSYMRMLQGNYALSGLVGFEMYRKTVGIIGTGAIGIEACRILKGIGCTVLAYDVRPNPAVLAMGIEYMGLDEMLPKCDIVSLHCPLLPSTRYIINRERLAKMKPGAMLINVSRGGLLETAALADALECGQIGAVGLDTYEHESALFFKDFTVFEDRQRMKAWDRSFRSLMMYPQVLITPHSAFLTYEALDNIANTTVNNIANWRVGAGLGANEVQPPAPAPAPAPASA